MSDLKNKVTSIFEEIQYVSEDLIAGLIQEAQDSPVEDRLKALRVASSYRISHDLKKASSDLVSLESVEEVESYLDHFQERFKLFVDQVKEQEAHALEGMDISDFIHQLKEESEDWVYKATLKSKELAQQVSDKLNLEDLNQKASETWHQVKDKTADVYEEVKQKSLDTWEHVKDKVSGESVEEVVEEIKDEAQEIIHDESH